MFFRINNDKTLTRLDRKEKGCLVADFVPPGAIRGYYKLVNNKIEVDYEKEIQKQKDFLKNQNNKFFTEFIKIITKGYLPTEIESWNKQELEAKAYKNDKTASVPLIRSIATIRGIELSVLVDKILEKSEKYTIAYGKLLGNKQKIDSFIETTNTLPELSKFDIMGSWEKFDISDAFNTSNISSGSI